MSLADCCGCGKQAEDVENGSGELLGKFDATAKTWTDIYVPQNQEKTLENLVVRASALRTAPTALESQCGPDRSGAVLDRGAGRWQGCRNTGAPSPPHAVPCCRCG